MDFGTFLREKEKQHPAGGGMDHFGAGGFHRFHDMEQGYRPRGPNIHRGYNDVVHYPGFAPRWNRPQMGGPYAQQRNTPMHNDYNNRRGASHSQNVAPRSRKYSDSGPSRQSQREVPHSQSGPAKKSAKDDDTHVEQDSQRSNQKQGPGAGSHQTQNSKGDNQAAADQSETRDQMMHEEQDNQEKEMEESYSGDSWKPIENTNATEKKAEDTAAEKEDEKVKAIKKLPSQHSRGLMSTLIELCGPEALNKKPDPLPPPQPMKLEDENEKYLRPSTSAPKLSISKNTYLESGITSKMLEEANMEMDYGITSKMLEEANTEIDYSDLNLLPEDIGRETGRNEFYCKLCKKQMTSLGNFRDHLNGKSHKSTLEAWKAGKKLPKGKKKATKPVSELGQKSVCLEVVEGEVEPILGLSFITEYHSITGVVCVCNLCAVKFDQNIVVSHTTGCKHRLRYMREVKPSVYVHLKKFGGKKSQLTAFLSDLCVGVEKEDGRGIPTIKIYNPESVDYDDSMNQDEYENRRLINRATRSTTVEDKELESVDFQDWVNREMRRAKEKYDAKKRSPSPGAGDYGRPTDSFRFGTGRQMLPHSDGGRRDYQMAPPMFPHSHPGQMYMPPPLQPPPLQPPPLQPPPFTVRQTPYDAYVGHGSLPPMTEQNVNPVSYSSNPVYYNAVDPGLDPNRHVNESRSHLSSNNEVSEKKSAILFDYGHGSRDEERDGIRTSRRSSRSRERDSIRTRRSSRSRERDGIRTRRSSRSRERDGIRTRRSSRSRDRENVSPSRKIAKRRADKFNEQGDGISVKQPARRRMDERDDISTPRQKIRIRMEERDDISTPRQKVRSRADEKDEVGTSRQLDRSRADRGDERESISASRHLARSRADERNDISNSRQSTRSMAEEQDEINTSRQKARNRADERNVSTSVSRADKWEDDIQNILGHSGKKKALDSLALLSRTYLSPEKESPSPPRKIKHPKDIPFSKTYLEVESQKSQKDRRSPNELHSDLDSRRIIVRKERFVEARPKSRSPDVTRVRHRSPDIYIVDSPQPSHLTRRQTQRVDSAELVYSQRGRSRSPRRSRSPVNVPRQQRRSRSPRDSSPVRSNKKPVIQAAPPSNINTDAEAERIANLLLELSSSLSGQEDPQIALQTLFSNADLTRALLSSKSNISGGKSSREKSSGEKMHSARSTEVGEPSGRHYVNVEKQSRYVESPEPSRRYAPNYTRSPEQTRSFARPESNRVHGSSLKPTAHSSRDRLSFSVAGFNRAQPSLPKTSLRDFEGDSDES